MKNLFLSTLVLLCIHVAQAQTEPAFTVTISNDSILFGNYLEVTFSIENAKGTDFAAPSFADFRIISGPNFASNFSMINGEVSQSVSYSYQLEPKDIGNFYLEPASIRVDDDVLETEPLEILVVPNPDGIIDNPRKGMQFQFDWGRSRSLETPDTVRQKKQQLKLKPKKKRKIYKI